MNTGTLWFSSSARLLLIVFLSIVQACSNANGTLRSHEASQPSGINNMAYKWGKIALECTASDTERFNPRPTVTSRMLALVWISVFDAWSRFDSKASPMYLATVPRRPASEHTLRNKEIAISYAAYRSMLFYFYSDAEFLRSKMKAFGLDPDDVSEDPSTPAGIGNLAAKSVIDARMSDGSNQVGDMKVGGIPYSDYTGYVPVNTPDELTNIAKWQPKYFSDGKGGKFAPGCLTPHWGKVKPVALDSGSQFRPPPPPAIGSKQLEDEVKEVVSLQANLSMEEKALVEFMRDGPKSVQQAGHWLIFAQNVSARDQHTLDEDVKLYFLVEMAAMDAFIACWESKMYYDFARPYALVHYYLNDTPIKAWGGPGRGMMTVKASEWRPYSPDTFLCPPFPGYVSGHSTVSGACAEVMRLFTGSDSFGEKVKLVPGILTEPDNIGDTVTLEFSTFTDLANQAGRSRVMGGYHIESDNTEGLKLGRNVAHVVWQKYQQLVNGSRELLTTVK